MGKSLTEVCNLALAAVIAISFIVGSPLCAAEAQSRESKVKVTAVGKPVPPGLSLPIWALPRTPLREPGTPIRVLNPRQPSRQIPVRANVQRLDEVPRPAVSSTRTPAPLISFEGMSLQSGGNGIPPDTVGDIGPNHYVQMVNSSIAVFNKSGTMLVGPVTINSIWSDGTVCETTNEGDPIVLYDRMADRWMISEFAHNSSDEGPVPPFFQCIAVSQTPDPTGAWFTYSFDTMSTQTFNDYGKFGVWSDGYYMGANEGGFTAYVFDRQNMITGATARPLQRVTDPNQKMMLPSDLDGATPPPPNTPNYFYTQTPSNIELWASTVDWDNPANSSFTKVADLASSGFIFDVCPASPTDDSPLDCIPQQGVDASLDAIGEWPMFRFQYRNMGTHESLVGNFTVDMQAADDVDQAGIHWFELRRNPGGSWTIQDEGNYAPDTDHRWMGSAAMDRDGNLAVGYSVSSSSSFPSIRYATRLATDPPGQLGAEVILQAGAASQSMINRWGDYSAMNVDPTDDCTFWYTTEYIQDSNNGWQTRIGSFKIASCGEATPPSSTTTTSPGGTTTTSTTGPSTSTSTSTTFGTTTTTTLSSTTTTLPGSVFRRFFPKIINDPTGTTGIAVVNLSQSIAHLTFTAYSNAGILLDVGQHTLPPGQQLALVISQILPNLGTAEGWLLLESDVPNVEGFFLLFDSNLTVMDGVAVSGNVMGDFVIPAADDVELSLANPSNTPAVYTLAYINEFGIQVASGDGVIPPMGVGIVPSSLLRPPGVNGGYLVYLGDGVVPLGLIGNQSWLAALNGTRTELFAARQKTPRVSTPVTLFAPQYAVGDGFTTVLDIVNLEDRDLQLTLRLIGDDGVQIGSTGSLTLTALGSTRIDSPSLFGITAGADLIQGYVRIESAEGRFDGWVRFTDPNGVLFGSALQFVGSGLTKTTFSQVAQDALFFTGLAALNPNSTATTVTIRVFDTDGSLIASGSRDIPAGGRFSKLLFELVGAFPPLTKGYFQMTSTMPVPSFALFGTATGSVLAAVPPQSTP